MWTTKKKVEIFLFLTPETGLNMNLTLLKLMINIQMQLENDVSKRLFFVSLNQTSSVSLFAIEFHNCDIMSLKKIYAGSNVRK